MSITVYGRNTSSNVQIVMWALAELGLEHERLDYGGAFGRTDEAEFRAINPMGLVPAITDGDVTMFESAAILRYLAARYGDDSFWPKDPAQRASLDQWAEWGKSTFSKALIYEVFWHLVRTPKAQRDPEKLAASVAGLASLAHVAEQQLSRNAFIASDNFTFADIAFGHALFRYYSLDFNRVATPKMDAYYRELMHRPAFKRHVMVDYSSLQVD